LPDVVGESSDQGVIPTKIATEYELIAFLEANNEFLIAQYIKHNIYLKIIDDDHLELSIKSGYDSKIVKKLSSRYKELTGKSLVVKQIEYDEKNKTITEQEAINLAEIIAEFEQGEEFAKFKTVFPDIRVVQ